MTEHVQNIAPVARVERVSKSYGQGLGRVEALKNVSVELRRGEFTAIMGPSGSGKSTLMHIMAGLDSVTDGEVWVGETNITHLDDSALTVLRRRHIGFIFQSFNLVPVLSVLDNVFLPFELDNRRVKPSERSRIEQLIVSLGLEERMTHRPHELSGGQQQRVAIARALALQPELIFADEPTGNLDSRTSREVLTLLRAASQEYGQSIVMVTHDPNAASYADRILFLADGQIVRDVPRASAEEISGMMLDLEETV
ncbi:MAG: ABC transporter ATP-binding protein [Microbacteriaceae bacterium]